MKNVRNISDKFCLKKIKQKISLKIDCNIFENCHREMSPVFK